MTRDRPAFLLGAVLLVGGVAAALVGLLSDGADPASKVGGFHRLAFSQGGGAVDLATGRWVGYYEVTAAAGGSSAVPDFRAFIRDPRGEQVNVGNYSGSGAVSYTFRGSRGVAILQFDAPQAGRYRVQLQTAGALPPTADLAIGRDLATAEGSPSRLPMIVGVLAAIAGVGSLGWGLGQRSRRPHVVSGAP